MAYFIQKLQKLQKHADEVCNILQRESEWIERYKGYVDTLSKWEDKPLKFRCHGELFPYITLSEATKNCSVSEKGKCKYFLRYLGQNVADISVSNETGKVSFNTANHQKSNTKNFGYDTIHNDDEWHSQQGKDFRKHFEVYKKREDGSKRNEEHRIQNLLLRELSKKKGADKQIIYIQPVLLQRCFLEIPTPLKGSNHIPNYAGSHGGGIDILARVKHGNTTRLGVIEVKDEYKPNENIFSVLNQAVTYACFIHKLLRSESGQEWCKLLGYNKPEVVLSRSIIIDAIAAMPNILPEDRVLFNTKMPARIEVGEDLIELHFISFEDNKSENKLYNIESSLRK